MRDLRRTTAHAVAVTLLLAIAPAPALAGPLEGLRERAGTLRQGMGQRMTHLKERYEGSAAGRRLSRVLPSVKAGAGYFIGTGLLTVGSFLLFKEGMVQPGIATAGAAASGIMRLAALPVLGWPMGDLRGVAAHWVLTGAALAGGVYLATEGATTPALFLLGYGAWGVAGARP
ncbi:MAG: hypothetical protein IT371_04505 [Deltaproteobacteria bacterium]|nr:hypothetical protein [Deltaproteobacteria bacterium]